MCSGEETMLVHWASRTSILAAPSPPTKPELFMSTTPLEIRHPRRLFLCGAANSGKLTFLQKLTGSLPTGLSSTTSHAGLSHTHSISTPYYSVTVPIWVDEIPAPSLTEEAWSVGYCSSDAAGVLAVLGGFVVAFRKPVSKEQYGEIKDTLREVQKVVKKCGYGWDGVCLAVAMPQSLQPRLEVEEQEWEELCRGAGFEYVDFEFKGRNEFGEVAGMERVKEALEGNDWGGGEGGLRDAEEDGDEFGEFEEEGRGGLKDIGDEMEREMFGLREAIMAGGDRGEEEDDDRELQVEELESTMMKLQALRDLGSDVPMEERQRLAAKTISDLVKS